MVTNVPKKSSKTISVSFSVPAQRDFQTANEKGLETPFTDLAEATGKSAEIYCVVLHPSYDSGDAVGYTQELISALREEYAHVKAHQARWEYFGSAIRGQSLLVVASTKPVHLDTAELAETTFGMSHPTCVRHAPKNVNLNALEKRSAIGLGFLYSDIEPLPPLDLWGNKRLVVEEMDGNRVSARRLTKEEVAALYGVDAIAEVNDLQHLIPAVFLDTLKGVLIRETER